MEKLRREWVDNGVLHWDPVYSAAEVDAYRAAVKALVEGSKSINEMICGFTNLSRFQLKLFSSFSKAIAAVERLEVE